MSNEKENPMSEEFLQTALTRMRKRALFYQDGLDATSLTIRCIENDLNTIQTKDGEANEKNA